MNIDQLVLTPGKAVSQHQNDMRTYHHDMAPLLWQLIF